LLYHFKISQFTYTNAEFCSIQVIRHILISSWSDYGIGIVDKCLGPMTSKGPTKDCC